MDDEFKLCWKNFQDNIASGFQSLYDRGDLVDVTLACDGKLLQAHKIVLAICSPYFQEIFISNPCKHPIIILKDVSYNIMCELLEFMYQGVVNVKHTELQSFMKIGQLLQIKGLATNSSSSAASTSSEKSSNKNENNVMNDETSFTSKPLLPSAIETASTGENSNIGGEKPSESNSHPNTPHRSQSPVLSPAASPLNNNSLNSTTTNQANKSTESNVSLQQPSSHGSSSASGLKRHSEYSTDSLSIYSRNKHRRSITSTDHSSENNEGPDGASVAGGMEQMNTEDFFLPHISMVESRYELNNIKRENSDHHQNPGVSSAAAVAAASASLRNSFNSAAFGLDYTFYKNNNASSQSGQEYPNDLHMSNEYSKSFANHMDIPPIGPGEHWFQGKLEFMLSQRGKPLLVHDGHTFGIQYVRKDKKYWQCNLSRKFNCKARVTTTDTGEIIVTNNEHCHTEIRQHLRKDYQRNKVMMNALINLSTNRLAVENFRRHNSIANNLSNLQSIVAAAASTPLALQSNIKGTNSTAANLLDLGKQPTINIDTENHFKHTQTHHYEHHIPDSMNKIEDDDSHDEPLDCGIRTSSYQSERDSVNVLNENSNNPNTPQPTIYHENKNDWQCKNEDI
ncbi:longitudinals lacking protein, isoforms H/M/V isoform X3 [Lucilia cuprina]|uniref:longitudinals lacking protein, isoforms H/M/V isoform X3 n=1 Tax=Lucilia cuprina TaxID=7375 RepID=UPI001F070097|nr:longitudinals lacking protein, isoforms H/M/V isoform X3 [Lucilia cuprina]